MKSDLCHTKNKTLSCLVLFIHGLFECCYLNEEVYAF